MTTTRTERAKTARYYSKRERVVDVAAELFSKNGYAGTGVADIGDAAGLARGALYYYIGSKEALLAEIHDRVMDPLLAEASAIVELEMAFETRLRLLSESLLWQIVNRQDHVWVFLHEYRQLQGADRAGFRDKRRRFERLIHDLLAEGHAQGLVRVVDLDLATLAFLNLHNYTYQWLGREKRVVEDLSGFYCDVFFSGILSTAVDRAAVEPDLERGRVLLRKLRTGSKPA